MTLKDYRELEISGATPRAREAFERALESHLSWRSGAEVHLEKALLEAPAFTMAHVLKAYFSLCNRDPMRVRAARTAHAMAARLPATPREQLHVAAMGAALGDDFESLKSILQRLLDEHPHDLLALQVGHALDYLTGDIDSMGERMAAALPMWSKEMSGYHAVLAMQAFSLVECAQYESAADHALSALEIEPADARAHHAATHVYEMTGNPAGGVRWMRERRPFWARDTVAATHCWWHTAIFQLALGQVQAALRLYDQYVRASRSREIADLIDAAALLWRIQLAGADPGRRWSELAPVWAEHIADGYCSFSDVHAMLTLVGAEDWKGVDRLERHLLQSCTRRTRYGETTRLVGLPACRAVMAFGRGEYARSIEALSVLPPVAQRIGGSHAQRDLLCLTGLEASRRLRRRARPIAA